MSQIHADVTSLPGDATARSTYRGALTATAVPAGPTECGVRVTGDLDAASAGLLGNVLDEQLAGGRRSAHLDLSGVTFLDCAGLRVLVEAHNRFLAARGALVLTGVGARVARLLRVTRLDEALVIADADGRPRRGRHMFGVPSNGSS